MHEQPNHSDESTKKMPERAPEILYGLSAIFLVALLWLTLNSLMGGPLTNIPVIILVLVVQVACIKKLLAYGIRIEKVTSWKKVYYSLPTYMLIALIMMIGTLIGGKQVATWLRSTNGLGPAELEGLSTIGVYLLGLLLATLNIVYGIVALTVGIKRNIKLKRTLFNIGLLLVFVSCALIALAYIDLALREPVGGYSQIQF